MEQSDFAEIVEVFKKASNMNAAVKKVLKQDIQDAAALKFLKSFKAVVSAERNGALEEFLQKHMEQYEKVLGALAVVAHRELVTGIVNAVIEQYADSFNATYETTPEGAVQYKDQQAFIRIVGQVRTLIEERLKAGQLPASAFMKSAVISQIFNEELLPEVTPLVV